MLSVGWRDIALRATNTYLQLTQLPCAKSRSNFQLEWGLRDERYRRLGHGGRRCTRNGRARSLTAECGRDAMPPLKAGSLEERLVNTVLHHRRSRPAIARKTACTMNAQCALWLTRKSVRSRHHRVANPYRHTFQQASAVQEGKLTISFG
jgi:hypothetical protein